MIFSGVYTALATPFREGRIDRESLARLIEHNIDGGVAGLVPVGTTGESPTLTHEEHREVIRLTLEIADRRVPVLAGTGSNCTAEAISLTQEAEKLGAEAALLVAPYYNRPTQEGLFLHYQAVAKAVSIPVVLYSIPGRCGVEIAVPTVARLAAACPNIRCLKEAGGSVERINQLKAALPEEFVLLSGDDSLTLPFLSAGAQGVISVASNLVPGVVSELVNAWIAGDTARAMELHQQYYPLFRDLFVESNPVPVKHALVQSGIIASPEVRLPLAPLSEPARATLAATLQALGLPS
jgi:4-hydroxy-tetrahydrodipicolinate synthase